MRKSLVALSFVLSPFAWINSAHGAPLQLPENPAHPRLAPTTAWPSYAHDASHTATSPVTAQPIHNIHWSTPVDLQPQYFSGELLIHYGTPLITPAGTILVTVKTGTTGTYQVEGHHSGTGALIWTMTTDYSVPPHDWVPSCASTLTPQGKLATPGAGGTIYVRDSLDSAGGTVQQFAFFGIANYNAAAATYNSKVMIDTPLTSDANGTIYFGFYVGSGSNPLNLVSGIARVDSSGNGIWVSAATVSNDAGIKKVVTNCAPALSLDGTSVYVAVNNATPNGTGSGYLLKLNSTTLALQSRVLLKDVKVPGNDAGLPDDGTASPTVGPDGDVYFGVLENPFPENNDRGWMLHYNSTLSTTKTPGAFGWDDTASIVPASCVPSYSGTSSYLILTKYNNYAGVGSAPHTGDGHNKVAILDPNATMVDPITGATVMKEVITVLGVTPDPNWAGGVTEWCINSAVVDPIGKCALVNNEDGKLYRWDFTTNSLTQTITLTAGLGEAYTPTLIGPDGIVYAINNAILFAVGH
jgi:hypothetical protein